MYITEYGAGQDRTMLFFPGSCTARQDYEAAVALLARRFRVFLVTPDGHDPEVPSDFTSVEETADGAARWLKERGITRLDALYGLSFGGAMAVRFLTTQGIPVGRAIIDAGTSPYEYPKWLCKLICVRDYVATKLMISSVGIMKMAFLPAHFSLHPENVDREYRDMQRFLKTFSNRTIRNIFWSANNYEVPQPAPPLDTRMQFWVGTEEWGSRFRDLKWYRRYLPQLEVVEIPGMMHGELVVIHPEEFAKRALVFLLPEE